MTADTKEDDAPCNEAKEKEENNTTASHAVISVIILHPLKNLFSWLCSHITITNLFQAPADTERSDNDCKGESSCLGVSSSGVGSVEVGKNACTPKPTVQKRVTSTNSKKQQTTAKKIGTNTKPQLQSSSMKSTAGTPHLAQENQAIKRQNLEGGKSRQVIFAIFVPLSKFK